MTRMILEPGGGFAEAYIDVHWRGRPNTTRGGMTKEIVDAELRFLPYERLSSFRSRKLNLNYCKQELLWYLRADRFDHSIQRHATMWKKLVAEDGGYHSNYGQYLFKEKTPDGLSQIDWVVRELAADPGSRRAVCVLLKPEHLYEKNVDVVCTYSIAFRIRGSELQMTVHMRSNDLIYGTTNDVFCFSCIHELVYSMLSVVHPGLRLGDYVHRVDSLHVYERHFDMLEQLATNGMSEYVHVEIPRIEPAEAMFLTRGPGLQLHRCYEFTDWLMTEE